MQNVMRVLPDGLGNDQRCAARNLAKDFHSIFLRINKTMSHFLTKTMRALDRPAFQFERFVQRTLHCKLSGFAFLICRSAKVSIGYEIDDWFGIHEGFDFTECVSFCVALSLLP